MGKLKRQSHWIRHLPDGGQADKMSLKYKDIAESIIGSAFSKWISLGEVYKIPGYGFLEKVYLDGK